MHTRMILNIRNYTTRIANRDLSVIQINNSAIRKRRTDVSIRMKLLLVCFTAHCLECWDILTLPNKIFVFCGD